MTGVQTCALPISWGYVMEEEDKVKFDVQKIEEVGLANNPLLKKITLDGGVEFEGKTITYDMVGEHRRGFRVGYIPDTKECPGAENIARGCDLLICEATYLNEDEERARENHHLTARQAAEIAHRNEIGRAHV